nr:hypothetical protein CFP56_11640 [Quercus suber]
MTGEYGCITHHSSTESRGALQKTKGFLDAVEGLELRMVLDSSNWRSPTKDSVLGAPRYHVCGGVIGMVKSTSVPARITKPEQFQPQTQSRYPDLEMAVQEQKLPLPVNTAPSGVR